MTDTFTQTDLMNYLRDELLKISNEKKVEIFSKTNDRYGNY